MFVILQYVAWIAQIDHKSNLLSKSAQPFSCKQCHLTCAVKTGPLNKSKYKFISPRKERRKSKEKRNEPSFEPVISFRFSEFLREAFIEQWCFVGLCRSLLCLTIRLTGMALTCDFPQLLQAYCRLISNTLYLGLPIYFILRPTVVSESLKNLNIERFKVLTAVLMKSQVFFFLECFL